MNAEKIIEVMKESPQFKELNEDEQAAVIQGINGFDVFRMMELPSVILMVKDALAGVTLDDFSDKQKDVLLALRVLLGSVHSAVIQEFLTITTKYISEEINIDEFQSLIQMMLNKLMITEEAIDEVLRELGVKMPTEEEMDLKISEEGMNFKKGKG